MKAFLRRLLGIESLSAQVVALNKRVRELAMENERLELEVTHFKAKSIGLNATQAGKLQAIVRDARRVIRQSSLEVA